MSVPVLRTAGPVLQLLRLAELHGPGRRTLRLAAPGAAARWPHLHHVPATDAARIHVFASPDVPPLLQRRPRPQPHARQLPPLVAAVAINKHEARNPKHETNSNTQ